MLLPCGLNALQNFLCPENNKMQEETLLHTTHLIKSGVQKPPHIHDLQHSVPPCTNVLWCWEIAVTG